MTVLELAALIGILLFLITIVATILNNASDLHVRTPWFEITLYIKSRLNKHPRPLVLSSFDKISDRKSSFMYHFFVNFIGVTLFIVSFFFASYLFFLLDIKISRSDQEAIWVCLQLILLFPLMIEKQHYKLEVPILNSILTVYIGWFFWWIFLKSNNITQLYDVLFTTFIFIFYCTLCSWISYKQKE
jgi:hypothetical protein